MNFFNFGKTKILVFALLLMVISGASAQRTFTVSSPDGKVKAEVAVSRTDITYAVFHAGDIMIAPSAISMTLEDGTYFGVNPQFARSSTRNINAALDAPVYKRAVIKDNFNELTLQFRGDYSVIFRAYDDGVAYRFVSTSKKPFKITAEKAQFNFPQDQKVYVPYVRDQKPAFEGQFFNSFENTYQYINLSDWDSDRLAFAPVLIDGANGKKVCITEADLLDYPGMYLYNGDGSNSLSGVFAPYPAKVTQGGHNRLQMLVETAEPYIAKYERGAAFPWRAIIISENDYELADNDMVYKLASSNRLGDVSWIKPGKVAWDWWNDWNLYGVDFRAGINNDTYKYYIDFASGNGIEYVILDEGWAVNLQADLFQVIPEIDLKMLCQYAESKNVGLILWAGYYAFERDMEHICRYYSDMGIRGFKVDFMDRDDQYMVDFHRRGAEMAAKYKLLIDYHGTYKPTGLQRTYPNVINFEGVHGLEQMKWLPASVDQVTYDVQIPFIRAVAGPMDYTQGAMRNATLRNYFPVNSEAMSQGTRARQLAQYVIFESPLNMMCDSPSNYMNEAECMAFIAAIPTTWEETRALAGKVGEYVAIARKSGDEWYVGSMTDWNPRSIELDLSFLEGDNYKVEIFRDGINADRAARDYKKESVSIPADKKLTIGMAPAGGFAMRIYR